MKELFTVRQFKKIILVLGLFSANGLFAMTGWGIQNSNGVKTAFNDHDTEIIRKAINSGETHIFLSNNKQIDLINNIVYCEIDSNFLSFGKLIELNKESDETEELTQQRIELEKRKEAFDRSKAARQLEQRRQKAREKGAEGRTETFDFYMPLHEQQRQLQKAKRHYLKQQEQEKARQLANNRRLEAQRREAQREAHTSST